MIRYLLDTTVLLHLVNKSKGYELIERRLLQMTGNTLAVSVITVWEIFRMAEKAKVPTKSSTAALVLLEKSRVIPMTTAAAALGGQLHAALANVGKTIGERDSMIAGIARTHGYILVTDNTGEFQRVPDLLIENWRK
ncbi:MAG: type II toxin-antitoxin system VapC family toxin [Cytophagales bacterium]|nr:type II toxin-antitoxin system VapC family toxin [Cytophagales bacterium]